MRGVLWATLRFPGGITPKYTHAPLTPHITLHYDTDRERYSYLIGHEFVAMAYAECWNERIQALRVTVPDHVPCTAKHPHITVSWVDGAAPVEANAMLADNKVQRFITPNMPVLCRVEFYEWAEVPALTHA